MAAGNNRNLLVKSLFAIVTMVVAYFSIVSTMTIYRVGAMERTVNQRADEIRCNERNIAVLLEKVTTVERLLREIRQALTRKERGEIWQDGEGRRGGFDRMVRMEGREIAFAVQGSGVGGSGKRRAGGVLTGWTRFTRSGLSCYPVKKRWGNQG